MLTEALTLMDTTGERWYEPELYRLKGELLLQQSSDNQAEAESCFHHALDIARTQQAKSFELRTATSLARLWQQQGKHQAAYDLSLHRSKAAQEGRPLSARRRSGLLALVVVVVDEPALWPTLLAT